MSERALLVFLKQPEPGRVKTRLVPPLGAQDAAAFYRVLAEAELAGTRPVADEYRRRLCFTPAAARDAIFTWLSGAGLLVHGDVLEPQARGDLGERMAAAFEAAFAAGARRVAVVGTDVPWLDGTVVVQALEELATHDAVVGPAADGGYYLLALREPQPALFDGIAWSGPQVLATTLARAARLGLGVRRLQMLRDVDTLADVRAEWPRLKPLVADARLRGRLERALREAGSDTRG